MKRLTYVLLTVFLFLAMASPALAQGGRSVFAGQNLVVNSGDTLLGDVAVLGGNLQVQEGGRIEGHVAVLGGTATIAGEIDGDLSVLGGSVSLARTAVITGDLAAFGSTVSGADQATVRGRMVQRPPWRGLSRLPFFAVPWRTGRMDDGASVSVLRILRQIVTTIIQTLAIMALGVLLVVLLPEPTLRVSETVRTAPLPSFGVGILTAIVLIVAVIFLTIICIGLPVAVLLALAAVAAGLFGWIAIGLLIGRYLLGSTRADQSSILQTQQSQLLAAVAIGLVIIGLIAAVPCLGWFFRWILTFVGLGAVVLTRFGTLPYQPSAATPELPPTTDEMTPPVQE